MKFTASFVFHLLASKVRHKTKTSETGTQFRSFIPKKKPKRFDKAHLLYLHCEL